MNKIQSTRNLKYRGWRVTLTSILKTCQSTSGSRAEESSKTKKQKKCTELPEFYKLSITRGSEDLSSSEPFANACLPKYPQFRATKPRLSPRRNRGFRENSKRPLPSTLHPPAPRVAPKANQRERKRKKENEEGDSNAIADDRTRSSIEFQGYTIVRVAWRRGEERANGFEPGLVIPTSPALRICIYTVCIVRAAREGKWNRRERYAERWTSFVSGDDSVWCRSSLRPIVPPSWFRPSGITSNHATSTQAFLSRYYPIRFTVRCEFSPNDGKTHRLHGG